MSSVLYSAEISLDKTSVYPVTPDQRTNTVMQLKENDIAVGMCNLAGITDRDGWDANPVAQGVQKLYVRAVAQLSGVESSRVVSNWVELPQVQGFFAIPSPGFIYFIGAASGWKARTPTACYLTYHVNIAGSVYLLGTFGKLNGLVVCIILIQKLL